MSLQQANQLGIIVHVDAKLNGKTTKKCKEVRRGAETGQGHEEGCSGAGHVERTGGGHMSIMM